MSYSVLFVCTANICRSPMAMALFQEKVKQLKEEWQIESAGTWALEGKPPAGKTQIVLNNRGITLPDHSSRSVSLEMLKTFNLILTMEAGQKEAIQVEFPEIASRVYLLTEMVDQKYDIRDPIGSSLVEFEETANEIDRILDMGFHKIRHLAEG